MAFDSATRNKLQRLVAGCRKLLTDEFDDQLQSTYGIYAVEGRVLDLEKLTSLDDEQRATGALLRDRIKHLESGLAGSKTPLRDAVQRVLREQAFTVLNRLAALRMAEERELVLECVGDGLNSKGFQVFENVASPDLGSQYERYRVSSTVSSTNCRSISVFSLTASRPSSPLSARGEAQGTPPAPERA
jgi:hypothetical protein